MRVVICGGGYAGVTAGHALERSLPDSVEMLLIDRHPYHLIQHELHRLVRRPAVADVITIPFEEVLSRTQSIQSEVATIDPHENRITLEDGESVEYDVGVVTLGSEPAYHGIPGIAEHGIPLKRISHADRIREAIREADQGNVNDGPRVVVGGAGLAGVQVAGEIASLESAPRVQLLEQAARVTPGFPRQFQRAVRRALLDHDIQIRTDVTISGADQDVVHTAEAGAIPYDVFVWTGGIRGPTAVAGDRQSVRSDLRLTDTTFAAGDAARIVDDLGNAVPETAQAAVQSGSLVATNVARTVAHRRNGGRGTRPALDRFTFDPSGWIVSIGDDAVATVGSTVVTGTPALALKATVGVRYLSSVGAVRDAFRLVREEFGIAVGQ